MSMWSVATLNLPRSVNAIFALIYVDGLRKNQSDRAALTVFKDKKKIYWKINMVAFMALTLLPLPLSLQICLFLLPAFFHFYHVVYIPQKEWYNHFKKHGLNTPLKRIKRYESTNTESILKQKILRYDIANKDKEETTKEILVKRLATREYYNNLILWIPSLFGFGFSIVEKVLLNTCDRLSNIAVANSIQSLQESYKDFYHFEWEIMRQSFHICVKAPKYIFLFLMSALYQCAKHVFSIGIVCIYIAARLVHTVIGLCLLTGWVVKKLYSSLLSIPYTISSRKNKKYDSLATSQKRTTSSLRKHIQNILHQTKNLVKNSYENLKYSIWYSVKFIYHIPWFFVKTIHWTCNACWLALRFVGLTCSVIIRAAMLLILCSSYLAYLAIIQYLLGSSILILTYIIAPTLTLACRILDAIQFRIQEKKYSLIDFFSRFFVEITIITISSYNIILWLYSSKTLALSWSLPAIATVIVLAQMAECWTPKTVTTIYSSCQYLVTHLINLFNRNFLVRVKHIRETLIVLSTLPEKIYKSFLIFIQYLIGADSRNSILLSISKIIPALHQYLSEIYTQKKQKKALKNVLKQLKTTPREFHLTDGKVNSIDEFCDKTWRPFLDKYLEIKNIADHKQSPLQLNHRFINNPNENGSIESILPKIPSNHVACENWMRTTLMRVFDKLLTHFNTPTSLHEDFRQTYLKSNIEEFKSRQSIFQETESACKEVSAREYLINQIQEKMSRDEASENNNTLFPLWAKVIQSWDCYLAKINNKKISLAQKNHLLSSLKRDFFELLFTFKSCPRGLTQYLCNINLRSISDLTAYHFGNQLPLEYSIQKKFHTTLQEHIDSLTFWFKEECKKPLWLQKILDNQNKTVKNKLEHALEHMKKALTVIEEGHNVHYHNAISIFVSPQQHAHLFNDNHTDFDVEFWIVERILPVIKGYSLSKLHRDQTIAELYHSGFASNISGIVFENDQWLKAIDADDIDRHPAAYFKECAKHLEKYGININNPTICNKLISLNISKLNQKFIAACAALECLICNATNTAATENMPFLDTPGYFSLSDIHNYLQKMEQLQQDDPQNIDLVCFENAKENIIFNMARNPFGDYEEDTTRFGNKPCHSIDAYRRRLQKWVNLDFTNLPQIAQKQFVTLQNDTSQEHTIALRREIAFPLLSFLLVKQGLLYKNVGNKIITHLNDLCSKHTEPKKFQPKSSTILTIEHSIGLIHLILSLPIELLQAIFPVKTQWTIIDPLALLLDIPHYILNAIKNLIISLATHTLYFKNTVKWKTCSINTHKTASQFIKEFTMKLGSHLLGLSKNLPIACVCLIYESVKLLCSIIIFTSHSIIESLLVFPIYLLMKLGHSIWKNAILPTLYTIHAGGLYISKICFTAIQYSTYQMFSLTKKMCQHIKLLWNRIFNNKKHKTTIQKYNNKQQAITYQSLLTSPRKASQVSHQENSIDGTLQTSLLA